MIKSFVAKGMTFKLSIEYLAIINHGMKKEDILAAGKDK